MRFAVTCCMAKRRAALAPLGLTSNGVVVVNALSLLEPRQAAQLRRALPKGRDWFVAAAVSDSQLDEVLARLDDAAAEVAARLAAEPRPKTARTRPKRTKAGQRVR